MRREDVISAGVQNCLMCLILSSALQGKATDPNLVDKETILSFLQVFTFGLRDVLAVVLQIFGLMLRSNFQTFNQSQRSAFAIHLPEGGDGTKNMPKNAITKMENMKFNTNTCFR